MRISSQLKITPNFSGVILTFIPMIGIIGVPTGPVVNRS